MSKCPVSDRRALSSLTHVSNYLKSCKIEYVHKKYINSIQGFWKKTFYSCHYKTKLNCSNKTKLLRHKSYAIFFVILQFDLWFVQQTIHSKNIPYLKLSMKKTCLKISLFSKQYDAKRSESEKPVHSPKYMFSLLP